MIGAGLVRNFTQQISAVKASVLATLAAANGSTQVGDAGSTVADRLASINLADYAALRAYAGACKRARLTGYLATAAPAGTAGDFVVDDSDTTSADDGAIIIVAANGKRWKRQFVGPASVRWFGAVGDGLADDTAALQAAINFAASRCALYAPSGNYKYTTALTIPSNVQLRGEGRHFGCKLTPVGCAAFKVDGSLYGGGWAFRIDVRDLLVDLTDATGADGVSLSACYNVEFRNVFFYNQPVAMTNGMTVKGSNDIVLDGVILYGVSSGVTRALNIDGTAGMVSIKLLSPDIESYNRGIRATGSVVMDIFSPYMERCVVDYDHSISDGMVSIHGGEMSSVNGYGINVGGDNLAVFGTDINPYQGSAQGGAGINAAGTTAYRNVNFYNVPRIAQAGFIDGTANLLSLGIAPTQVASLYRKTIDFKKTVADNVLTDVVKLANFDTYAKCKLTLHGYVGLACLVKEFTFIVNGSTTVSTVTPVSIVDTSGGNWTAVMGVTLTPNGGGAYVMVSVTVDTQGALGNGQPFTLYGQLELVAAETGVGGVYLQ